jgi:hypothetical protein
LKSVETFDCLGLLKSIRTGTIKNFLNSFDGEVNGNISSKTMVGNYTYDYEKEINPGIHTRQIHYIGGEDRLTAIFVWNVLKP